MTNMNIKKKFKITDMHCSSCALTIDMELEDLDGVKQSRTRYAKGETEIEFDPKKVKDNVVVEVIKRLGYSSLPLDS